MKQGDKIKIVSGTYKGETGKIRGIDINDTLEVKKQWQDVGVKQFITSTIAERVYL